LRHIQHNRRPLHEDTEHVLKHLMRLWGFTVRMETVYEDGTVELTQECRKED